MAGLGLAQFIIIIIIIIKNEKKFQYFDGHFKNICGPSHTFQ
jgi:hypothetical protein